MDTEVNYGLSKIHFLPGLAPNLGQREHGGPPLTDESVRVCISIKSS